MSESSKVRTISGRYVSYRYYGDTSQTYNHGGIVVIATHHDKSAAKVYGGLCIVPDYVTKHKPLASGGEMTTVCPHKYEQKAARAIADSRLHHALFGAWSEELESEIRKHATWAPDWRPYTEAEISEKAEKMRSTLPGTVEEVEARVSSYVERLRNQRTPDVVDPINLRRPQSSFVTAYAPEQFDGDLTSEDIDEIVASTVIDMVDAQSIPAWVASIIEDEDDDEDEYDTSKPCVVDLSDGDGIEYGLAMVRFRDGVCVGYEVVDEALNIETLLEQAEANLEEVTMIRDEINGVESGDSRLGIINVSRLDDLVHEDSSAFDELGPDGSDNEDIEDDSEDADEETNAGMSNKE